MIPVNQNNRSNQHGYMIILTMILVFVLMGTGLAIASTVAATYASTKRNTYVDAAVSTAEAGVSATISELGKSAGFTGFPDVDGDRGVLYDSVEQGKAEYGTTVTANANGTKTIVSTGYVYANNTESVSTNATNKKTIEVVVNPREVEIAPSIFAGPGGLTMSSASGSGGNVYVMGKMSMALNSTIGSVSNPVNLQIGNIACTTAGAYPTLCPSNQQPLNVAWGTIRGTVCATNQTDDEGISPSSGFQPNCTAPPLSMPYFDKKTFTDSMTSTRPASSGSCSNDSVTLTANTRYTGTINNTFYCTGIVDGNIYIDGSLNVRGSSLLRPRNGLTTPPTIVVNGKVDLSNQGILKNDVGTSLRIISFDSVNAACSSSPSCTALSNGGQLEASANHVAIECTFCQSNGATLWAYFGKLYMHGPTNILSSPSPGAAIGNSVEIRTRNYGVDDWDAIPPGSVKMVSGYSIVSYKQNF